MSQIHTLEALQKTLRLTPSEMAWHEDSSTVPLAITDHFLSLIDPDDPCDPLRAQVVPTAMENSSRSWENIDPLAEVAHSINPRLVHRYANRVAFLVTDVCPMYCRHCFRRRFTGSLQGPASEDEMNQSADYVGEHPEIREILLTGGDMLTLSNNAVEHLIGAFRSRRPDLMIRLCTRYLASDPSRIDCDLINVLRKFNTAPIFIMTQFNHPRELCPESLRAIALFADAGFPLFNQSVLLHGVNDDPEVLAKLCENLLAARVKPYYLFQGDLVSGTSHFRVPLERGIDIFRKLSQLVSGLALPVYAIDLPNGMGKVNIGTSDPVLDEDHSRWTLKTPDGHVVSYPAE
jgi:lysine 2,3-aminomutase